MAQITIADETRTVTAALDGNDKDKVIGRDGSVLDAVQHLAVSAAANNGIFKERIVVDVDGYRKRQDEHLIEAAERLANEAKDSGTTRDLDPMNARERRLVHMIVSQIDGVTTESMGMGDDRYVRLVPGEA